MSPLKIMFLLRMYGYAWPNQYLSREEAYSPAMAEALKTFQNTGIVPKTVTLDHLFGINQPIPPTWLTLKGKALVQRYLDLVP